MTTFANRIIQRNAEKLDTGNNKPINYYQENKTKKSIIDDDPSYKTLKEDNQKFEDELNEILNDPSYQKKGGKKKKKSSRKHGRTRSKRPRNTRRRRVSPKRNRGSRRK